MRLRSACFSATNCTCWGPPTSTATATTVLSTAERESMGVTCVGEGSMELQWVGAHLPQFLKIEHHTPCFVACQFQRIVGHLSQKNRVIRAWLLFLLEKGVQLFVIIKTGSCICLTHGSTAWIVCVQAYLLRKDLLLIRWNDPQLLQDLNAW